MTVLLGNPIFLVAGKMSKSIGLIHKSSFHLSADCLRMLYNSLILPYLSHYNLVWGGTCQLNLQRLIILQKAALIVINKSRYDACADALFKKHKLLKCHDIHSFQLGIFMFSELPTKFHNFLRNNRSMDIVITPEMFPLFIHLYVETNIRKFSSFNQGPKFFHSLTPEIACSSSLSYFFKKINPFAPGTFAVKQLLIASDSFLLIVCSY